MKIIPRKWDLLTLLTLYWENRHYVKPEYSYGAMPIWEKFQMKWLQSVFNAITGKQVSIELRQGRKEIGECIEHCFGQGDEFVTDEQLVELQKLFPYHKKLFDKFSEENQPRKRDFYYALLGAIYEGLDYLYMSEINVKYPSCEKAVNDYKTKVIDKHIIEHNKIFAQAIVVLLGKNYGRKYTRRELEDKYGMPKLVN